MKFIPFTVKVNAPPPTLADGGENVVTDGIGLSAVGGGSNVGEEPPQPDNSMMKISSKIAVALHDSHLFKLVQTRTGAFLRISSVCVERKSRIYEGNYAGDC